MPGDHTAADEPDLATLRREYGAAGLSDGTGSGTAPSGKAAEPK